MTMKRMSKLERDAAMHLAVHLPSQAACSPAVPLAAYRDVLRL